MKTETKWRLDEKAESVLIKLGIDYEIKTVAAAEINQKMSRVNMARPKAIDAECVEDYAKAMSDGDVFPTIVLAKISGVSERQYVIAGGNHRHMAAVEINGETTVMALCCKIDEIQFDVLCKSLNSVEGRRESRAVRVDQACDMCRKYGISPKEAASSMRVSISAVQAAIRASKTIDAAVEAGIKIASTVPKSSLEVMHYFKDDANVLRELAHAVNVGATASEITSLCSSIKDKKTEAERIMQVQSFVRDRTPEKKSVTRSNASKLMTLLGSLERLVKEHPSLNSLQITSSNADEVIERWERTKHAIDKAISAGSESYATSQRENRQLQSVH